MTGSFTGQRPVAWSRHFNLSTWSRPRERTMGSIPAPGIEPSRALHDAACLGNFAAT